METMEKEVIKKTLRLNREDADKLCQKAKQTGIPSFIHFWDLIQTLYKAFTERKKTSGVFI